MKLPQLPSFFLLLSLFLFPSITYSQSDGPCAMMNTGIEYFRAENIDSAIICWKAVLENFPDTNECYGNSWNNIAVGFRAKEEYDSARVWYNKIIASDLDDKQEGPDIMEPYANYHHNACMQMAIME